MIMNCKYCNSLYSENRGVQHCSHCNLYIICNGPINNYWYKYHTLDGVLYKISSRDINNICYTILTESRIDGSYKIVDIDEFIKLQDSYSGFRFIIESLLKLSIY